MQTKAFLSVLSTIALAKAQVAAPAPSPSTLTTTQSGVLPIAPTPFPGLETIEGAITYDGPIGDGFTGPGGNATIQNGNPIAVYQAVLPTTNFDDATGTTITGSITGAASYNETGVVFTVNFTGFPAEFEYGPFVYHIHGLPVSSDGNCTATLGHLDPTNRGGYHPCEDVAPETCQAGDLAGKHGNITGTSFTASYLDLYLSTSPGSPYFFGDKSIVIHSSNTTRLTCANFTMASVATSTGSSPSSTSSAAAFTGAANTLSSFTPGVLGSLAFFLTLWL